MNTGELQQQLFAEIKRKTGADASMVDEVARLLAISTDSAYRRIRGEKTISLDELHLLCTNYKISLDQMMNIPTGTFQFRGNLLDSKTFNFEAHLTAMMHIMAYFNSFENKEYYYLCKDVPIFYHWQCREFAAFKYYFWLRTIINFPEFRNKKVDFNAYPDEIWQIGQKILSFYDQLDSYELWNMESMNSTIHQIEYYRDNQVFNSDQDALKVYEALEKTMDHLEEQARLGYKFNINDPSKKPMGKFQMYVNEIILLDNSMIAVLNNTKMVMIPHTVINYFTSTDVVFGEYLYNYTQNLMRRSTQISEVSEKERSRFFRILRERVARRKEALKV